MYKKKLTAHAIANRILNRLERNSNPENSTWGRDYSEARNKLFGEYRDDLINDIETVLLSLTINPF